MQVIIDVPEKLARQLEGQREHLAEILELGLSRRWSNTNSLWREVLAFLARGPKPDEIVEFHASDRATQRMQELLEKSKEHSITAEEEAELDGIEWVNHLFALIKARAWKHVATSS